MKSFSCKDVGVECTKNFMGQTDDEIMEQVETHAREDHGFPALDENMRNQIKGAIHDIEEDQKEDEAA